jgi:hypothetical protein
VNIVPCPALLASEATYFHVIFIKKDDWSDFNLMAAVYNRIGGHITGGWGGAYVVAIELYIILRA